MSRLAYVVAEMAVTWLLLVAFGAGFVYFTTGFTLLTGFLLVLLAFAALGLSARLVLWGGDRRPSFFSGVYRPFRPIAGASQVLDALQTDQFDFSIRYVDRQGRDAFDIVHALAEEMQRLGLSHRYTGALSVEDGATRWRVDPALDAARIDGWVEAPAAADRDQIVAGLHDFLSGKLGIAVMEDTR